MFQSTPGINAGRIRNCLGNRNFCLRFQSTPGINAGRIAPNFTPYASLTVSIHARH